MFEREKGMVCWRRMSERERERDVVDEKTLLLK